MPDLGNVRGGRIILRLKSCDGDKGLLKDDVRVAGDWGGGPVSGKEGRED